MPHISPDGKWALWVQGKRRLIIRSCGRGPRADEKFRVPKRPARTRWSDNGRYIALLMHSASPSTSPTQLYVIDRSVSDVQTVELAERWGSMLSLEWLPDTSQLLCGIEGGLVRLDIETNKWRRIWSFPADIERTSMDQEPAE